MSDAPHSTAETPYADLSPETILDALESAGFDPTGGLLELNSYENRVFQAELESGGFVVTKFYRPGRWSDAQIAEEHAFSAELAEADVPVVIPIERDGATLGRRVGVPQPNVDAERRGGARLGRRVLVGRHKVVEVRLRADEELQVRARA